MSPFDRQDLTDSNNQFAFDLYAKLSQGQSSNLFFSPYSVSSALAMTLAGARSKTEREMAEVLHLRAEDETIHVEYSSLIQLIFGNKVHGCRLSVANRIWAQSGYDFLPEFLELLYRYYDAQPETLDFVGQPEPSRLRINQWVGGAYKGENS